MLFIGKSSAAVSQAIQRYVYPLTWLIIGFVALVAVCIYFYTRRFVAVLLHIHSFLSEVASGNLNATLDHSVTKRSDELGDIGRCALSMQRSLRTMIEQDALTELYNRRSGEKSCARSSRKPDPPAILLRSLSEILTFSKRLTIPTVTNAGMPY